MNSNHALNLLAILEQDQQRNRLHAELRCHPRVLIHVDFRDGGLAEPLYMRSLAISEKTHGPDHPNVATSLENLAVLCRATEKEAEAVLLEARAARIRAIKR